MPPPRFSVTTATLLFPDAVGQTRVCVPCIMQEGHHLRHSLLGDRKDEMLRRIAELPRRSRMRQIVFMEMHQALRLAATQNSGLDRWQQRLRDAIVRQREEQTLFDRELAYILQPAHRLEMLVERYRQAMKV
jgi:hypothetical protein